LSSLLKTRRAEAKQRLNALNDRLSAANKLAEGKACVYVTGSFGRGEGCRHSDLDLFIVGHSLPPDKKGHRERSLSRLNEICIKADLIRESQAQSFPPFSGDGEYLIHYTIDDLTGKLGTQQDDALNTFTARLLLLLESRALIGQDVWDDAIRATITAYWRDYEKHKLDFVPAFLTNDILRLWRTFCVNYEARTKSEPQEQKAKRKLKNYKLKHSRLLTCYSAVLYLLAEHKTKGTVAPEAALAMTRLSPMERVEALHAPTLGAAEPKNKVVACYEKFLSETDAPESELLERFLDRRLSAKYLDDARLMGDAIHELLRGVGEDSQFYRLLVV
jgi:predicted nucleotidyltransferase